MRRRTDIEQFQRQISLSATLFGARIGTTLAEETLVFTSCEQNFVQLSNVQAVFSANAARARSLQCFSYYAPLPFPSLMEFFQTSALEVHLQLSIRLTPFDLELQATWRSRDILERLNLSILYHWKLQVPPLESSPTSAFTTTCLIKFDDENPRVSPRFDAVDFNVWNIS